MGALTEICHALGVEEIKFKPGFFPFTEPSVEGFIKHPDLGWIEALPGGIFRPEVTRNWFPKGDQRRVLAFGLGIGRIAMTALGISDIRDLYSTDLGFLRRAPLLKGT